MPSKPPTPRAPYRRRRVLWTLFLITAVALFQLYRHQDSFGSWSLPSYLKDVGGSSSESRARVVADAKAGAGRLAVQEIHGLLHFVTAYPERTLDEDGGDISVLGLGKVHVDPQQQVDLRVYAPDGDDSWQKHMQKLQTDAPLVVFSKSYCPYSRRAKTLLESYKLVPPPVVVELDLRSDGPIIQAILKRLTGRSTVPNVILHGESLGGSDDVHQLHDADKLKPLLEQGGLLVAAV